MTPKFENVECCTRGTFDVYSMFDVFSTFAVYWHCGRGRGCHRRRRRCRCRYSTYPGIDVSEERECPSQRKNVAIEIRRGPDRRAKIFDFSDRNDPITMQGSNSDSQSEKGEAIINLLFPRSSGPSIRTSMTTTPSCDL
jgi:hypothetical protein